MHQFTSTVYSQKANLLTKIPWFYSIEHGYILYKDYAVVAPETNFPSTFGNAQKLHNYQMGRSKSLSCCRRGRKAPPK